MGVRCHLPGTSWVALDGIVTGGECALDERVLGRSAMGREEAHRAAKGRKGEGEAMECDMGWHWAGRLGLAVADEWTV